MAEAPEIATASGVPGYNDRWSDDSPSGIARRATHLDASLRAVEEIRPDGLSPAGRLNHRLYRELLRTARAGRKFGDDAIPFHFGFPRNLWMPISQMDGIHTSSAQLLPMQPRRSRADVEAIVERLRRLPVAVDQTVALLEDGRKRSYVPPKIAIRGLPDQVVRLVPESMEASAYFESFRELPSTIAATDRAELTARARTAYADGVRPAMLRLHRYLVDVYLPAARDSIAAGELPQGAERYAYLVRWTTTTDLTPRQIHEIGLAEVRRTEQEIEKLVRSTGFKGTVPEFHRYLRTDPKFRNRSGEEMVDRYRVIAKRIDPELARHFGRLPRLPYGVVPVPDFQAPDVPAAYYIPGSPDDGRPGTFFANTYDIGARPTWRMESMTLHEAVPGHHLQIALASEKEDLPDFRKFSGETAYIEGWGLYAESLGEELGLYRDPYARFGCLDHDVWRSIRLVVDTGMHALGWSRARAIEFFREHTGMSELDITVEVDRYIVWPSQALAYKIGALKFRELRTLAERELGDRFDERAFHDVVLGEGALPLGELEARVRAWIGSLSSKPPRANSRGKRPVPVARRAPRTGRRSR